MLHKFYFYTVVSMLAIILCNIFLINRESTIFNIFVSFILSNLAVFVSSVVSAAICAVDEFIIMKKKK